MPFFPIHDIDDPRLNPYRNLKLSNQSPATGHLIAEGHRVVRRLVESDFAVDSILVTERRRHLIADIDPERQPIYVLSEELASQLVGYHFHGGVVAAGWRHAPPALAKWLPRETESRQLIVICPRITDPDNLGTIIRLCVGFGVRGLILGPGSTDPYLRRVLRVSMGHAFFLPILPTEDLRPVWDALREQHRFRMVATVLDETATVLSRIPFGGGTIARRWGLVFGNEADGLDQTWIEASDERVTIPMGDRADSLNVAVSAGVCLHWFRGDSVQTSEPAVASHRGPG